MPFRRQTLTSGFQSGVNPFSGPINHQTAIQVDLSVLTNKEIDADGYLKPGIPLTKAGALLGVGDAVFGVTIEAVKVAEDNAAGTISALGDVDVAVATIGAVKQAVAEAILDRVYTADEIAGFDLAGSKLVLV